LAPIGFARIVNEITVRPRPASPGSTITVETDHPHVEFSIAHPPRGAPAQVNPT
jgi:hypothetical protein